MPEQRLARGSDRDARLPGNRGAATAALSLEPRSRSSDDGRIASASNTLLEQRLVHLLEQHLGRERLLDDVHVLIAESAPRDLSAWIARHEERRGARTDLADLRQQLAP